MAFQPYTPDGQHYITDGKLYRVYSLYEGYTISFSVDGGVAVPDINDVEFVPVLPTTTKTGYAFNGWYYDALLTQPVIAGDALTGDTTVYAAWVEIALAAPNGSNTPLTVCGNNMYALSRGQLSALISDISTSTFLNNILLLTETPSEALISLRMYPFDIVAHAEDDGQGGKIGVLPNQTVYLGVYNTAVTDANDIFGAYDCTFDLGSVVIPRYFGNFLDFAPYTKLELWLPFIGFTPLDVALVMGKTLSVQYVVDFQTGKCTAYVSAENVMIMTVDGVIGIDIPLTARNGAEVGRDLLKVGVQTGAGALSLVGGAIAGGAAQQSIDLIAGTASGAASWSANTSVSVINAMQTHMTHKGNVGDGFNAYYAPTQCFIVVRRPIVNVPTSYNHTIGRPLAQTRTLGSLSGFTQIDSVHMDGFAGATVDERQEVERLLKTGVIL